MAKVKMPMDGGGMMGKKHKMPGGMMMSDAEMKTMMGGKKKAPAKPKKAKKGK